MIESVEQRTEQLARAVFPALVSEVLDEFRVVINRGAEHGVRLQMRFVLYAPGTEEVRDPVTNSDWVCGRLSKAPVGSLRCKTGLPSWRAIA